MGQLLAEFVLSDALSVDFSLEFFEGGSQHLKLAFIHFRACIQPLCDHVFAHLLGMAFCLLKFDFMR